MLNIKHSLIVKVVTSLALLTLIATQVSWKDFTLSVLSPPLFVIVGAFAMLTFQTLALSLRWYLIVNTGRKRMPYKNALQITFAALIANFLFLTSISGLAVRIALTIRQNVSVLFSISASLIDRLMTVFALIILAAIFMPFSSTYIGTEIIVISGILLATILMLLIGLFSLSKTKYGALLQSSRKNGATIKYIQSVFSNPKIFGSITVISLIAQLSYFTTIYILVQSLDIDITIIQLLTVLPMIALIASLPIGIGGWGIREGAFIYGLGLLNVQLEQAVLISVQIGLLGLISAAIIGLPAWFLQDKKPKK